MTADTRTLETVLARYPIEGAQVLGLSAESTRNDNYFVAAAGGERYVLRRYRRNRDPRRVDFQLRFQQHLFDAGYPVPAITRANDRALTVLEAGAPWALCAFVMGAHYDHARIPQAREAGRQLAAFHEIGESFVGARRTHDLAWAARQHWTEGEADLDRLEARFGAGAIADEVAFVRRWLHELVDVLPLGDLDALPSGWLHEDYHGRNLIYEADHLVALLDFDKVERGAFVLDIQRGLHAFSRERRGSYAVRPAFARAFLDGYESVRPLTADERKALPVVVGIDAVPVDTLYGMLERDGEDPLAALRSDVEVLRGRLEGVSAVVQLLA